MLKGKKKLLAVNVLLGLLVAGSTLAEAADYEIKDDGTSGSSPTAADGVINLNNGYGGYSGGTLIGEGGVVLNTENDYKSISGKTITVSVNIYGSAADLIMGNTVSGNTVSIGVGYGRNITCQNALDNIFGANSSGNTLQLGAIDDQTEGGLVVNAGNNNIELAGAGDSIEHWDNATSSNVSFKKSYYENMAFSGVNLTIDSNTTGTDKIGSANMTGTVKATNALTAKYINSDKVDAKSSVTLTSGKSTVNTFSSNGLTLTGTSTLTADTVNVGTGKLIINSTAEGTILTAKSVVDSNNKTVDLATAVDSTAGTMKTTALLNKLYKPLVQGSSIVNGVASQTVRPEAKSVAETGIAAMSMVNSTADLTSGAGYINAVKAVMQAKEEGVSSRTMVPYAAAGYGNMRQESGSHVDVKGAAFNVGFAKEVKNSQGVLLFGPLFEYGRSNYDSTVDSGVTGSGTAQNYAVGMMARQTNNNGFYYEGSLRYGRASSDYSSSNLLAGQNVSYDTSANYWGMHAGLGKVQQLGGGKSLDIYGKLFYTSQGSSTVDILGDSVTFDGTKSKRSRLGIRYIQDTSKVRSIYAGLAWQYEFDGAVNATANGQSLPSPSVKGSSAMAELGIMVKPQNSPVAFDLGVSGWTGKQKGYSLNANMLWSF